MALFNKSASDYDQWCQTPLGSFVDKLEKNLIKEVARPTRGEVALDIGCGTGIYSYWLSELGLEVTGIDLSTEMLAKANEKANAEKIQFIQGDIHKLPFADGSFDLVVSNIVMEFVENPKQVVNEALRVLKPGGRFVCGFIGKESFWGEMYQEKGKGDKDSVFHKASFFNVDEIKKMYKQLPIEIKYGLFVTMDDFENEVEAKKLEAERRKTYSFEKAGYIVAKWEN
ncbi:class I SAM-dependent methyltransferase [Bacillaceae bacterium IKA-2]|nr:class I SAM-dependent methyltransferase [Bacillaceae bacterium IKA-2]